MKRVIFGKGKRFPKGPSVTKFSESGEPQQMLVRQRRKDDCVIACLAMFLGYSYENVWDKSPKGIPRTLKDYEKKIQQLGINPIVFVPRTFNDGSVIRTSTSRVSNVCGTKTIGFMPSCCIFFS